MFQFLRLLKNPTTQEIQKLQKLGRLVAVMPRLLRIVSYYSWKKYGRSRGYQLSALRDGNGGYIIGFITELPDKDGIFIEYARIQIATTNLEGFCKKILEAIELDKAFQKPI